MTYRTPLVNPSGFFADHGAALFSGLLVAISSVILEVVVIYSVLLSYDRATTSFVATGDGTISELSSIFVTSLVTVLVVWLLFGTVMHYASGGDETSGRLGDALGVVGWAHLPGLVLTLILALAGHVEIQPEVITRAVEASGKMAVAKGDFVAAAEISARVQTQLSNPLVAVVSSLWAMYILACGVSETHRVSVERTAVPAIVVGLAWTLVAFL